MTQTNNIGLFVFRRDHRINDNTTLKLLLNKCSKIYTIFIFTPEQVVNNKYKSEHSIQFMIESLYDLENQIKKSQMVHYVAFMELMKI